MASDFIESICSQYETKAVDGRAFVLIHGYPVTIWTITAQEKAEVPNQCVISFEIPGVSPADSMVIAEYALKLQHGGLECEYRAPALVIQVTDVDPAFVCALCDKTASYLEGHNIKKEVCTLCREDGGDYCNVNGHYCLLHNDCANKMLAQNSAFTVAGKKQRAIGYILGFIFAAIGATAYILFASLGIMPALGGITMGLAGALGFRLLNKGMLKSDKIIFFLFFLLLATIANFAGDYTYAMKNALELDFNTTYSDPLNLINTIFDVAAGSIIALSGMTIVFDWSRLENKYRIKKI